MQMELTAMILQAGQGGFGALLMPIGLVVIMLFLIVPQQRRQKKWQQMLGALKTGDKVVTSGGVKGVIVTLKDAEGGSSTGTLIIRVAPDNIKLEVTRNAVVTVITDDASKA